MVFPQIRRRNLQPAMAWIEEHKLSLQKHGVSDTFEFLLHRLQFLTILEHIGASIQVYPVLAAIHRGLVVHAPACVYGACKDAPVMGDQHGQLRFLVKHGQPHHFQGQRACGQHVVNTPQGTWRRCSMPVHTCAAFTAHMVWKWTV